MSQARTNRWISFFLIVFVGLVLWQAYEFYDRPSGGALGQALSATPLDAAFVLRYADLPDLLESLGEEGSVWEALSKMPLLAGLAGQVSSLDSLLGQERLRDLSSEASGVISAHLKGQGGLEYLHVLELESSEQAEELRAELVAWLERDHRAQARDYEGVRLCYRDDAESAFSLGREGNLLYFSFYPLLVEEAIRQRHSAESLLDDPGFAQALGSLGQDATAHWLLKPARLPDALNLLAAEGYKENLYELRNFADWLALDLRVEDGGLRLNGFARGQDERHWVSTLEGQEPHRFELPKVLPASTFFVLGIGFSDYGRWMQAYGRHLARNNASQARAKALDEFRQELGIDLEQTFAAFMDNELAFAVLRAPDGTDVPLVFMESQYADKALQELGKLLEAEARRGRIAASSYRLNLRVGQGEHPVYEMPSVNLLRKLYGKLFSAVLPEHFTLVEDYVVWARRPEELALVVEAFQSGQVLASSERYARVMDPMDEQSNLWIYADLPLCAPFFSQYAMPSFLRELPRYSSALKSLEGFALQMQARQGMAYVVAGLSRGEQLAGAFSPDWECQLDTLPSGRAYAVLNHATGQRETLVQDLANRLHLVSASGRLLWTLPLEGPILGTVAQVDRYANNKLQLLFCTESRLHLVDREGQPVEGFPVELAEPAARGLSAFDYDGQRDYRVFVPTRGGGLLLYDGQGKPVRGWSFGGFAGGQTRALEFVRWEGKDYLLAADRQGARVLHRQGHDRLRLEPGFQPSPENAYHFWEGVWTTTDVEGRLWRFGPEGQATAQVLDGVGQGHRLLSARLDGDSLPDWLFLQGERLMAFSNGGQAIWQASLAAEATGDWQVAYHRGQVVVGVHLPSRGELWLFGPNGKPLFERPFGQVVGFSLLQDGQSLGVVAQHADGRLARYSLPD